MCAGKRVTTTTSTTTALKATATSRVSRPYWVHVIAFLRCDAAAHLIGNDYDHIYTLVWRECVAACTPAIESLTHCLYYPKKIQKKTRNTPSSHTHAHTHILSIFRGACVRPVCLYTAAAAAAVCFLSRHWSICVGRVFGAPAALASPHARKYRSHAERARTNGASRAHVQNRSGSRPTRRAQSLDVSHSTIVKCVRQYCCQETATTTRTPVFPTVRCETVHVTFTVQAHTPTIRHSCICIVLSNVGPIKRVMS